MRIREGSVKQAKLKKRKDIQGRGYRISKRYEKDKKEGVMLERKEKVTYTKC